MTYRISHCIGAFFNNSFQMSLAAASLAIAVAAIYLMRSPNTSTSNKIRLVYIHLAALFFTPVFFAFSMKCGGSCNMALVELAAYSIPSAFALSFIFGFLGAPEIYLRLNGARRSPSESSISEFVSKHSARLNIPAPAVFFADSPKPFAFSFSWPRSMIVLSVGLADLFSKKETEAVLLHELHHAETKASVTKLSTFFMNFSPFAHFKRFNDELDSEEIAADMFAAKTQGTSMHLDSAKKKIGAF